MEMNWWIDGMQDIMKWMADKKMDWWNKWTDWLNFCMKWIERKKWWKLVDKTMNGENVWMNVKTNQLKGINKEIDEWKMKWKESMDDINEWNDFK